MRSFITGLFVAVPWAALAATPASAQENQGPQAADAASPSADIVVLARKRTETITQAPYSVSAVSGAQLERLALNTPEDISRLVPNFYIDSTNNTSSTRVSIRGISNPNTVPAFEQSVGLSIDGIYFGRSRWLELGSFDLDQVEVLRGPQGVYFGKNTTAGLINFVSRGPSDHLEAQFRGSYEFVTNERLLEGSVGGPLTSTLGARLAVQYRKSDGYADDLVLGGKQPRSHSVLARLTLKWEPTDNFKITSKSFYADQHVVGFAGQLSKCTAGLTALLAATNSKEDCKADYKVTRSQLVPGGFLVGFFPGGDKSVNFNESYSQSVSAELDLGSVTLKSITGYQHSDVTVKNDSDNLDLFIADSATPEKVSQFSQEVRLSANIASNSDVVIGAYYDNTKSDIYSSAVLNLATIGVPIVGSFLEKLKIDGESFALFGEAGIGLTPSLKLSLGGRYTIETKRAHLFQDVGSLGNPFDHDPAAVAVVGATGRTQIDLPGRRRTKVFDPSVVLAWKFLEDLPMSFLDDGNLYASFKKGFKSGGFDLIAGQDPVTGAPRQNFEFGNERAEAYEVGLKFKAMGSRLQGSVVLFSSKFKDLQVQSFDTAGSLAVQTFNAAAATSKGVEVDLSYIPARHLSFTAGLGYTHARYDKFPNAPCYNGQTVAQGCVGGQQNLAGKRLVASPDWNGSFGTTWEAPLSDAMDLQISGNASYRSSILHEIDQDPNVVAKGYWSLDGSVALKSSNDRWNLSLIGRNLTDHFVARSIRDAVFFAGSYSVETGLPRTIALQLIVKY
jgi:outer membrane receptor protein involved in Fe transport